MTRKGFYRSWLTVLPLLLGIPLSAYADTGKQQVLVALPAVYALTSALGAGTALEVVRVPPDAAVPMESQANALSRLDAAVFQQAEAVVTLSSLWRADPLYATGTPPQPADRRDRCLALMGSRQARCRRDRRAIERRSLGRGE